MIILGCCRCPKKFDGYDIKKLEEDMSIPLGVEAGQKNYAPEDMSIYANYTKDIILNNPLLPSEITKNISELAQFSKEMAQKHIIF